MTILQIEVEDARPVAVQCDDHHLIAPMGASSERRFGGIRVFCPLRRIGEP
jgi:hypothetical protein